MEESEEQGIKIVYFQEGMVEIERENASGAGTQLLKNGISSFRLKAGVELLDGRDR